MSRLLLVFLWCFCAAVCHGHRCPNVKPMHDFFVEGILGPWYTVQKTDAHSDCITGGIVAVDAGKGLYELTETSPSRGLANVLGLQHEHNVKFRLQVTNPTVPAILELSIPVIASFKLTVLDTDFINYAVFVVCNKRFSLLNSGPIVAILSRTPTLEPQYLEMIYSKLLSYNINPFTIKTINHQQCPKHGEQGVLIKAASGILDSIKQTVGGITGALEPKKPAPKPHPKPVDEFDPSVTGEGKIDVRSSFT